MFAVRGFLKCNTVHLVVTARRIGVVYKLLEVDIDGLVHLLMGVFES